MLWLDGLAFHFLHFAWRKFLSMGILARSHFKQHIFFLARPMQFGTQRRGHCCQLIKIVGATSCALMKASAFEIAWQRKSHA